MKRVIILCTILFFGCASDRRTDWDSGGAKQSSYDQQQQQEHAETIRDQRPMAGPASEVAVP